MATTRKRGRLRILRLTAWTCVNSEVTKVKPKQILFLPEYLSWHRIRAAAYPTRHSSEHVRRARVVTCRLAASGAPRPEPVAFLVGELSHVSLRETFEI